MLSDPSVSFFLSFVVCQKVVDFFGRLLVKRFALCYQTVVCPVCLSVCLSVSVTLVYCGQTVGWIKMPLGSEVQGGQNKWGHLKFF